MPCHVTLRLKGWRQRLHPQLGLGHGGEIDGKRPHCAYHPSVIFVLVQLQAVLRSIPLLDQDTCWMSLVNSDTKDRCRLWRGDRKLALERAKVSGLWSVKTVKGLPLWKMTEVSDSNIYCKKLSVKGWIIPLCLPGICNDPMQGFQQICEGRKKSSIIFQHAQESLEAILCRVLFWYALGHSDTFCHLTYILPDCISLEVSLVLPKFAFCTRST